MLLIALEALSESLSVSGWYDTLDLLEVFNSHLAYRGCKIRRDLLIICLDLSLFAKFDWVIDTKDDK